MEEFKIKTEVFEGPLDILLSLIEKRKLLINDISLSKVADDFMEYIRSLEHFPVGTSANFILTASTLLLIKSRSLLPNLVLTTEEEESIDNLELRLKLLNKFRDVSLLIKQIYGKSPIFEPIQGMPRPLIFSAGEDTNTENLYQSMLSVIQALPKKEALPKTVVKKVISLEETIIKLTERIQKSLRMDFGEFANKKSGSGKGSYIKVSREEKVNVIVSFLAVLELVKQGIIRVTQESNKEGIQIESQNIGIPRYE